MDVPHIKNICFVGACCCLKSAWTIEAYAVPDAKQYGSFAGFVALFL